MQATATSRSSYRTATRILFLPTKLVTPSVFLLSAIARLSPAISNRGSEDNGIMAEVSPDLRNTRLRKHADYQRVYRESRKHSSPSMSYFFRMRTADEQVPAGPRVGLTAGRVLGKAVERNRIKRRMREAVRLNLGRLPQTADVVLHPRKAVADMEFAKLQCEVARIFSTVTNRFDNRRAARAEGEQK